MQPPAVEPDFVLGGKLGIRLADDGGSARFHWVQTGAQYRVDLWGVFGQGRTRLEGDARDMRVVDGSGAVLAAGDPAVVMLERLGWSLPVDVLPRWLWGRPAADHVVEDLEQDAQGRIAAFTQLAWQVRLDDFETHAVLGALPRRVTLTRPDLRARIVIHERTGGPPD